MLGADKHALFLLEEYDEVMFDEKTNKEVTVKRQGLITQYDRKFYQQYDEMKGKRRSGEIKAKEFYEFERKHFDYELTPEGQKAFDDYMEEVRQRNIIDIDVNGVEKYDEEAIEKERKRVDPQLFKDYLENATGKIKPNSGASWFTKIPKNIPLNPKYTALTPEQKAYHEYFSNEFMKAYENSVFDYRVGTTDIDQKLLDFAADHVTGLGNNIKHISKRTLEMAKGWSTVEAGGVSSNKVTRTLTGSEHIGVQFKGIDSFIPETGKVSPIEVLKSFKQASVAYKHKKDVEEVMNTINDMAKNALKHEKNNAGVGKVNASGLKMLTKDGTNVAARLDYSIRTYLSGKATDPATTNTDGLEPGQRGVSGTKIIDSINTFTRIRYMAFAPISAVGNFLMGGVNNSVYAASGEYFTDKELIAATWHMKFAPLKFIGNTFAPGAVPEKTKLIAEIMYKHNIIGDVTEELIYGESAINKLFILQKGGEFLVQGASAVAQMLHHKVDMKDGSKSDLFHLYKLVDGRAVLDTSNVKEGDPILDPETQQKIFAKIKLVNQKIHGDYTNAIMGKKTALGRMMFLFRTWLPMAVKERFGEEYEHNLLGTQKGRYRSAGGMVTRAFKTEEGKLGFNPEGAVDLGKTFLKMILPIVGKRIKLGDKVSDVDRRNIELFVREVHLYLTIAIGVAMVKVAASDDEDDETKGMLNYIFNQGERIQNELAMFYMPSSATAIMGNVIPMTNTLIDAQKVITTLHNRVWDPENDIYKSGFRKGDSKAATAVKKFLPVVRSGMSVYSSWSQMYNNPQAKR
jgi:hypothetical protein